MCTLREGIARSRLRARPRRRPGGSAPSRADVGFDTARAGHADEADNTVGSDPVRAIADRNQHSEHRRAITDRRPRSQRRRHRRSTKQPSCRRLVQVRSRARPERTVGAPRPRRLGIRPGTFYRLGAPGPGEHVVIQQAHGQLVAFVITSVRYYPNTAIQPHKGRSAHRSPSRHRDDQATTRSLVDSRDQRCLRLAATQRRRARTDRPRP